MSARPPEKGDSILNGHSDASRGVLRRVRLTSSLGGNVAEGYACGPFGDMRTGETPLPVVAHRRTARSPSPYFRKVCRSRLRSHLPQIQPLTRSPRTCFEGPFGEVLRATGPMAKANPFRFSTKYQDGETDLLYYRDRYYNASTGRWISRDPIGESASANAYAFGRNVPVSETAAINANSPVFESNGDNADPQSTSSVKAALPPIDIPITPSTTVNSPSGNGAGNGPVALPVPVPVKYPRCNAPGSRRGGSTDSEQCPCSGIYVPCIKFQRCERVDVTIGTSPLPPRYYWIPHRTCARCPEGRYGNY
jgi:RHS repeat-associated protein